MEVNTNPQNSYKLTKKSFNIKSNKKGLVLKIHNTTIIDNKSHCIRFIQASFSNSGQFLALGTNTNQVFIFDFVLKKCWSLGVLKSGLIKFSTADDTQILICDVKIYIYNFHTGNLIQKLQGHKYKIKRVDFLKNLCVTSSEFEAIIWDLKQFRKIKILHVQKDNAFKFITFVPVKNVICACFEDYFLQIWDENTFGPAVQILLEELRNISITDFAFTSDGKIMIIAGSPRSLYIYTTNQWKFLKNIELPLTIHNIKSISCLSQPFDEGSNKILVILSSNGALHFFDLHEETIVSTIKEEVEIKKMTTSYEGIYLSTVMSSGKVFIYKYQDFLKPHKTLQVSNISQKKTRKKKILHNQIKSILTEKKLKAILTQHGEYPELYRKTIWSMLLQCPNNEQHFDALLKAEYETFQDLETKFPLQNKLDLKNMKQHLSLLVSWSNFFNTVDYLPIFIYPFVHYLHNHPVQCFEIISMVILNYCQFWFEYHPLPPLNILGIIENTLIEFDFELVKHLHSIQVPSKTYAWPILQSAFSEVLGKNEWLILWDHIISNEPAFLLLAVVAFILINKQTILKCNQFEKIVEIFTTQNPVNFKSFIKKIYFLLEKISEENHPRRYISSQRKTCNEIYLKFEDFPKVSQQQQTDTFKKPQNFNNELKKKSEQFIRLSIVEETYKNKFKKRNNKLGKSADKYILPKANTFELIKKMESSRKNTKKLLGVVEKDLSEKYCTLKELKYHLNKKNSNFSQIQKNYANCLEETKQIKTIAQNAEKMKKLQYEYSLILLDSVIKQFQSISFN